MTIEYKYDENKSLEEIKKYIDSTYGEHYSTNNNVQSMDIIIAYDRGEDFCIGNILKLASRYGKKDGKNRKDLLKIIHYAIFLLNLNDK